MPDDKIQREIEDILSRLDHFVPEEGVGSRVRKRSSGAAESLGRFLAPLAFISIKHVMLAALALIVIGFFAGNAYPAFGRWTLIGGVILLFTAIALSFFNRGNGAPQAPEKRWRGQPMQLEGPTFGNRVRAWFQAKRRPRY
jgi:hypothetical protein